jgi:hypothetical protein
VTTHIIQNRAGTSIKTRFCVKYILCRCRSVGCRGESVGGYFYAKHNAQHIIHILSRNYNPKLSFRSPETLISLHKTLFVTHYIISLYKTYTTLYTTLIILRASLLTRYYIASFNTNNTHYINDYLYYSCSG